MVNDPNTHPPQDVPAFHHAVPRETGLWRRAIQVFAGTRPARVIPDGQGGILFVRYFLFRVPHSKLFGRWAGGQAYLHHYLRPDTDRELHDHPWNHAVAVQLAGGYEEFRFQGFESIASPYPGHQEVTIVRDTEKERRPGAIYFLTGYDFHTVARLLNDTSWSFFLHGRYTKMWGFLESTDDGHIRYRAFDSSRTVSQKGLWWKTAVKGRKFHERK